MSRLVLGFVVLSLFLALSPAAAQTSGPEEAVALYGAAWAEADPAKRRALLEKAWAEDGVYTDPSAEVKGRDALHEHIGAFLDQGTGASLVLTSKVDSHHGHRLRFSWSMVSKDGQTVATGIDYGEVDDDGRLRLIVGFFGPFQPVDETR
ncbi:MAG: nuclear transport factor 2 family protein [Acidobacteriota bacterium]